MVAHRWDKRFFESTRGRVVASLRRGSRTVEELAAAVGVTDNAVRTHLATLERDGLVRQQGVRPTGGKPAFAYELTPGTERMFSQAYEPVLTQLVGILADRLPAHELELLLREVGRRLAGGVAASSDDRPSRAAAAAAVLTELGGVADVEEEGDVVVIRGYSCPLAEAVRAHPATCHAAEAMVAELTGWPVRERCEKGDRPRCRFEIGPRSAA